MSPQHVGWTAAALVSLLSLSCLPAASRHFYGPTWCSLDQRPLPQWYDEAKFGIFLHWGVYSVPAFKSEWFWHHMKSNDTSVMKYMKDKYPPGFQYEEFAPMFTAKLFNATEWADVFHDSGARYVVLTSKHHDGFALWPSAWSPGWNVQDTGPRRDIVRALSAAVRKKGLRFGLYYSLKEWFHPLYVSDKESGFQNKDYVYAKMLPEMRELVQNYLPDVVWTDGILEAPDTYFKSEEFLSWLYNESPVRESVVVNDRWGAGTSRRHGGFYSGPDKFNPRVLQKHKWENCLSIDTISWGYRKNMDKSECLTVSKIIEEMVSTVSCGGNLLLNVGPTSEGTIAPIFLQRLREVGAWLKINGEAIFNTTSWTYQNDTLNSDVWYTQSKTNKRIIYAIILKWPENDSLKLHDLLMVVKTVSSIKMLGGNKTLKWFADDSVFVVNLGIQRKQKSPAWTLIIKTA